jgi:putative glutamine amidotransferase
MTQKQTVIGVVPCFDNGVLIPALPAFYGDIAKNAQSPDRLYIRRDYLQAIRDVGATPLIIHPEMSMESIMMLCDGIIISGGADIDPSFYKQDTHEKVIWTEPRERFEWEGRLIDACDEYGRPIFGVCYGMQRLNVHYGGTLIQDIASQIETDVQHFLAMHEITFNQPFMSLEPNRAYTINARHHQAIDQLAPVFTASATAPDGIVEALEGNGHFGVQWHPESDSTGSQLYGAFVEYCTPQEETVLEQQLVPTEA